MPLKMTMMFKKYIITWQISNFKLKKSVFMADFFNLINVRNLSPLVTPEALNTMTPEKYRQHSYLAAIAKKMSGAKTGLFTELWRIL